ncbi:MAG: Gfo/Idh/MocA family oxidoreductase [Treponema sp.]|jgi:hypothetical protein|nr:Gfo/Idh/MocA family oxidoreductase [Treponema sp.]
MREKIPAAVIGLGRIASLLEDDPFREKPCTHAGAIAARPDCFIAAGADLAEERRRLFAERYRCPVYADAAGMIRSHHPRILVIATYPDSHEGYCRLAASLGVPVVICEKPLADTLKAARNIAGFHRKGPVKILTNHERRYSADYLKAKELLDRKILGPLLSVRACLYMGKTRRILDVLWHDGTHLVDALMFLTDSRMRHQKRWGAKLTGRGGTAFLAGYLERNGPPALVPGFKNAGAPEPVPPAPGPAGPLPPKGIPFLIELGAERDHLVFELEFSCVRGRLRIGNGIFEVWESGPSPYAEGFRSLKKTDETFNGPTGYFAAMVADAVACLRDQDRQPRSSAAEGLRVTEYLNSVKPWGQRFVV